MQVGPCAGSWLSIGLQIVFLEVFLFTSLPQRHQPAAHSLPLHCLSGPWQTIFSVEQCGAFTMLHCVSVSAA